MQSTPWARLAELYLQTQSSNPLIVLATAGLTARDRALLEALVQHSAPEQVVIWKRAFLAATSAGAVARAFVEAAGREPPPGTTSLLALRAAR